MLKLFSKNNNKDLNIHFFHGNSFTPNSYVKLLDSLSNLGKVKVSELRPLWDKDKTLDFSNWDIFLNDYLNDINNEQKIIGVGHSIGGNILLKAALKAPHKFEKIILLDPTFFVPTRIRLWKIISFFNIQSRFLPLIDYAENKRMTYDNVDQMYNNYRRYKVFSKFLDEDLKIVVNSLIYRENNKIKLLFNNKWDAHIYRTSLFNDMFIWKNIKNLKIESLIIKAEHSDVFLKNTSNLVLKKNPKIIIETLKNSDHLFPINNYKKTYDIIDSFIQ